MAFYNCTVYDGNGAVVSEGVRVNVEQTDDDGAGWYGTLSVTHVSRLVAGEKYRMVLDDGRVGEFLVRRNTFAGGQDRAVSVHGTSPLRRD